MSTVMYCFRVPKRKIWDLADTIKSLYLHGPTMKENDFSFLSIMARNQARATYNDHGKYWDIRKAFCKEPDHHVRLQVFDRYNGYIVRALVSDYFFLNNWERVAEKVPGMTPVFYDDRSDQPSSWKRNKEIAKWVDEQISAKRYFIVDIITDDTLDDILLENIKELQRVTEEQWDKESNTILEQTAKNYGYSKKRK